MVRVCTLVAPFCLALAGCALAPPDEAPTLLAPSLAAGPAGPATVTESGAWTTEDFGFAPVTAAARPQDVDHDDDDLDDDLDDVLDDMDNRHLTVMIGERWLDDDEWEPVEDQLSGGLVFDATDSDSGHGYEVGMTYSQDDDDDGPVDIDAKLADFFAGYRYTFDLDDDDGRDHGRDDDLDDGDFDEGDVHPYLGAGGTVIWADAEIDTPGGDTSEDDWSPGAYIRAGIGFDVGEEVRLGLDYRHVFLTDVDIGSIDDADFDQFMLTLGFPF